ncbi:hypothetical protein KFK09_001510 [Dendrobium nobile]|uniref:Reverse transcriptase domain-containing protein n=1 Tax=Dendrobium nobile TaxID=94219 RepID=A0A8T3C518_DENNO|nr:hypothetical protein KFK09_001510 [Dendrobium nobile]
MLFADDILLVDKAREGVEGKLKLWRSTLEFKERSKNTKDFTPGRTDRGSFSTRDSYELCCQALCSLFTRNERAEVHGLVPPELDAGFGSAWLTEANSGAEAACSSETQRRNCPLREPEPRGQKLELDFSVCPPFLC